MRVKVGLIIANIAGSAGGQTIRRFRGGHVFYNKSAPARNWRPYFNQRLGQTASVFRAWGALSESVRNEWNYQATLYQFVNKWGDLTFIPGRQLFTKLNINCTSAALTAPDPFTLDAVLENVQVDHVETFINTGFINMYYTSGSFSQRVVVSACRLKNSTDFINVNKMVQLFNMPVSAPGFVNIYGTWVGLFGVPVVGQWGAVQIITYSPSGFVGARSIVRFKMEP